MNHWHSLNFLFYERSSKQHSEWSGSPCPARACIALPRPVAFWFIFSSSSHRRGYKWASGSVVLCYQLGGFKPWHMSFLAVENLVTVWQSLPRNLYLQQLKWSSLSCCWTKWTSFSILSPHWYHHHLLPLKWAALPQVLLLWSLQLPRLRNIILLDSPRSFLHSFHHSFWLLQLSTLTAFTGKVSHFSLIMMFPSWHCWKTCLVDAAAETCPASLTLPI